MDRIAILIACVAVAWVLAEGGVSSRAHLMAAASYEGGEPTKDCVTYCANGGVLCGSASACARSPQGYCEKFQNEFSTHCVAGTVYENCVTKMGSGWCLKHFLQPCDESDIKCTEEIDGCGVVTYCETD